MTIKHTITTTLDLDTEYTWQVRYKGANYGWSEWSNETTFTTLNEVDYASASNFTRSSNFTGAIGEDVIKVNSTMGVAPSDQSNGVQWGCEGTTISGADSYIYGDQNTTNILNGCATRPIAASVCSNHGDGNWYLPAKTQLETLYSNRSGINGAADNNFVSTNYWSSTEVNSSNAYNVGFYDGYTYSLNKANPRYVRCVRSF